MNIMISNILTSRYFLLFLALCFRPLAFTAPIGGYLTIDQSLVKLTNCESFVTLQLTGNNYGDISYNVADYSKPYVNFVYKHEISSTIASFQFNIMVNEKVESRLLKITFYEGSKSVDCIIYQEGLNSVYYTLEPTTIPATAITGVKLNYLSKYTTLTVNTSGATAGTNGSNTGILDKYTLLNFSANSKTVSKFYEIELKNSCSTKKIYVEQQAKTGYVDMNYVKEIIPIEAVSTIQSGGESSYNSYYKYFDGLGRPVMTNQMNASPTGKDIISYVSYDQIGRLSKTHLPFTASYAGLYFNTFETDKYNFYDFNNEPNYSFKQTILEASALNRTVEIVSQGEAWSQASGHTTKIDYQTCNANEIYMWQIDDNGDCILDPENKYYPAASLMVTQTKNENWVPGDGNLNTQFEYKDLSGKVILKRSFVTDQQTGTVQTLETYYVYDGMGLLRFVIPPMASDYITPSTLLMSQEALDKFCYQYTYDFRQRLTTKKLPGAESLIMVYDDWDRVVATQDGEMRKKSQWLFTKYDALDRPIVTGILIYTGAKTMQTLLNDAYSNANGNTPCDYFETLDNSTTIGYSEKSFPRPITDGTIRYLTVNYYDTYDLNSDGTNDASYSNSGLSSDYPATATLLLRGLKTKVMTRMLNDNDTWMYEWLFYDDYGRLIQKLGNNTLNGTDVITNRYSFDSRLLSSHHKQTVDKNAFENYEEFSSDFVFSSGQKIVYTAQNKIVLKPGFHSKPASGQQFKATIQTSSSPDIQTTHIENFNTFDKAGRLIGTDVNVNNSGKVKLSQLTYDETGHMINKKLYGNNTTPVQDMEYAYNIRDWLSYINYYKEGNDAFTMRLYYETENIFPSLGYKPQYNGNIAALTWKNYEDGPSVNKGYIYKYDELNRLLAGNYIEANNGWTKPAKYDEDNIQYDKNGNIRYLMRNGDVTNKQIDDLKYDYDGNQLLNVTDRATTYKDLGFKDGTNADNDYNYDDNGNLIKDRNKGISTITYNLLNLPYDIKFDNKSRISYDYDATGTKTAKKLSNGTKLYYLNEMVYDQNRDLQYIQMTEGRILQHTIEGGTSYTFEFHVKDHLGNTRAIVQQEGSNVSIKQSTNYYPFGMDYHDANTLQGDNKYLYNGKELQTDFDLNWYDYGARFYDAQLGRWHSVDPMAEKYNQLSPYVYVANNPTLLMDPDGERIWLFYGNGKKVEYKDGKLYNEKGEDVTDDVKKDSFVKAMVGLLDQVASTAIGKTVIDELQNSIYDFNLKNEAVKRDGKELTDAAAFDPDGNEKGGGDLLLKTLLEGDKSDKQKIQGISHELFHAYQHNFGEEGSTINSEVGAELFAWSVYYDLNPTSKPWVPFQVGNTKNGMAYRNAMVKLMTSADWSPDDYKDAINNFRKGSWLNRKGYYDEDKGYTIKDNDNDPLIKKFVPLLRKNENK